MVFKKHVLALFLALLPLLIFSQQIKIPLNPKVKYGQLPNGLKYYILQNKKPEKKVELRLAINAGSILEDKDQLGLAHMMEHMNFNGLQHFPGNEVVHYLQRIGVEFGADLNAYTSFDETVYILPIPADDPKKIEEGFQIIADWSGAALLESSEIAAERNVVLEESRLGKGADDRMMKKWLPEFMNGSLYAQRLPIGDDELLKTFPDEVLKRFHHDWYRPNLEAVMVVGDIDPTEAERLIIEKFSGFKNPENPRPRPDLIDVPRRMESKNMVLTDPEASYTQVQIIGNSIRTKESTTEEEYMNDVKKRLFNMMFANRLDELRNKRNPPYVVAFGGIQGGWARGYENFQLMAICGNDKIKEATEAMVTEAMRIKTYGFTLPELERAKTELLAQYEKSYKENDKTESRLLVDELVRHFLTNEPAPGIEWEYNLLLKKLPQIGMNDFTDFGNSIDITKDYFALVTTKSGTKVPTEIELGSYIQEGLTSRIERFQEKKLPTSLLTKEPKPGSIIKEEKNEAVGTVTYYLSNSAKVTYKKTDFKNDEIIFSGYRKGGSSLYTGKDYQSADFCNNVVDEMGYGSFSNSDLQKFMMGKTASVSVSMDLNSEMIEGGSNVKDFETALQLLHLKCTQPRLDKESFLSFKNKQLQMLAQVKSDPQSFYMDSVNKFLYQNHPRIREIPDPSDYEKIDMKNAVTYYNQRFSTASGMNYFFVGSIPEAKFKSLIATYIGSLAGGNVVAQAKDLGIEPLKGERSLTIKLGDEPKSMVNEMAYQYTPYNSKDEFKLNVLSEVINNRITDTIREKMSAIYGGGVGLRLQKFPKEKFTMQSYLPCGPENAANVKKAFWEIINQTKVENGISSEDLKKATETLRQKYLMGIKTNGYWLAALSKMSQFALPYNQILKVEYELNNIQIADLTAVSKKYLSGGNVLHALLMPANSK